jgi:hypothetical protein
MSLIAMTNLFVVVCGIQLPQIVDKYQFIPSTVNLYRHRAGGIVCTGTLDTDGNFMPNIANLSESLSVNLGSGSVRSVSGPVQLLASREKNEKIYEFRCGYLVPMIFDNTLGLVPEVGGKIIKFEDYQYSTASRRIYNLPGHFVPVPDSAKK